MNLEQRLRRIEEKVSRKNEASGDYSSDEEAMATAISENFNKLFNEEVSATIVNKTTYRDLLNGDVRFSAEMEGQKFTGTIKIRLSSN